MDPEVAVPPLPPGFTLDAQPGAMPPLPPGFTLDAQPSLAATAGNLAGEVVGEAEDGMDGILGALGDGAMAVGNEMWRMPMHLASGVNRGLATAAGALPELVNQAPQLGNLLPGTQGIGPISEHPVGGIEDMLAVIDSPATAVNAVAGTDLTTMPPPENMFQRITQRVGQEIGGAAPFVGVGGKLAAGGRALDEMSLAERHLAAPMRVNPVGAMAQEAKYAGAAGVGAGVANEAAGATGFSDGQEGNVYSDTLGSLFGALGMAGGSSVWGLGKNVVAGATGNAGYMDDVVKQAVTDQLIDNSSLMHAQAEPAMLAGTKPQLDTAPLAELFRNPAAVEKLVPGYTADIGTRANDPMLKTFVQDANARSAGAGNSARTNNNAAVNERVDSLAPQGDPTQFRTALQGGVDDQIASLFDEESLARVASDEAQAGVTPRLPHDTARGSVIREGLQGANDEALDQVAQMYAAIEAGEIDPAALAATFANLGESLPVNAPRPAAAAGPGRVVEARGEGPVPFQEAQAIRSNLSDEQRAARQGGKPYEARIAGQYKSALDDEMLNALDPDSAAAYQDANRARADVGRRFEEKGTGIAAALKQTERGGYALDASALPSRFVQPDTGKISDYQALMRETGADPAVRGAVEDQVMADAQPAIRQGGDAVQRFLDERNVVLGDFPELRGRLERAGVAGETLRGATEARTTAERDLTTPGRSPEADYLYKAPGAPFGNDESRRSIARIVNAGDSRAATRKLLDTAKGDPAAVENLRSAFWEEVKGRGQRSAVTDLDGQDVWNPRAVRAAFNDPKFTGMAEELWSDAPDDLQAIRDVFDALEAATPGKARAPGSSGTAQSLSGRTDPALTATSIASRARSVNRGQLSLGIALVDIGSTYLRRKSATTQARGIDAMMARVVNTPGLAADLLEEYNPATYAAKRQMLTQKYGARVGQLLTILDKAHEENEDPDADVKGAVDADD